VEATLPVTVVALLALLALLVLDEPEDEPVETTALDEAAASAPDVEVW
jgi:hypothetical protein